MNSEKMGRMHTYKYILKPNVLLLSLQFTVERIFSLFPKKAKANRMLLEADTAHCLVEAWHNHCKSCQGPFHSFCTPCLLSGVILGLVKQKIIYFHVLILLCPGDCGDLPRYNSMKTKGIPARPYNTGYKVQYECRPGYRRIVPFLPLTAVCHPNNSWTALKEACTKKACVQLAEPINGQVQYSTGTTVFGSEARFTCNEGCEFT
ncbi:PREDICTED: membrane cofactor protein-like isoform X2 [Miniopterus natalensis]|uniref:membrane cofactor protein-like isoform X2 n=1 Tax=Miniopterus natalensis TaxID=291302 RepID=UPI0007A6BE34|nr:PREDICTED: membrane cofactor protein-like isoform X2 [Miniopterus natalensis]